MTRQAHRELFDASMDAARAIHLANADAFGSQGAAHVGGIIETTREICYKFNGLVWMRDEKSELSANAKKPRSGADTRVI